MPKLHLVGMHLLWFLRIEWLLNIFCLRQGNSPLMPPRFIDGPSLTVPNQIRMSKNVMVLNFIELFIYWVLHLQGLRPTGLTFILAIPFPNIDQVPIQEHETKHIPFCIHQVTIIPSTQTHKKGPLLIVGHLHRDSLSSQTCRGPRSMESF